jgi:DNA-binding transcriptional ArsR family regulator
MRGKDYNAGLRGVLFEARHHERMGSAVWLYGWLVLRETHESNSIGYVLGGAPITYREIEEETGFNRRTIEGWLRRLRRAGYVKTDAVREGVRVRITKAKKFGHLARNSAPGVRGSNVRRPAGGCTQPGVAGEREILLDQYVASGISSSSVERIKERGEIHSATQFHSQTQTQNRACHHTQTQTQTPIHTNTENPSGSSERKTISSNPNPCRQLNPPQNHEHNQTQNFPFNLRARMSLLRAERDEAVRRELAVGAGPEVGRR